MDEKAGTILGELWAARDGLEYLDRDRGGVLPRRQVEPSGRGKGPSAKRALPLETPRPDCSSCRSGPLNPRLSKGSGNPRFTVGRAFGVPRARNGAIFAMPRGPAYSKDAWRFHDAAFVNSEKGGDPCFSSAI
jgi:hypothetical protein